LPTRYFPKRLAGIVLRAGSFALVGGSLVKGGLLERSLL
jgi:hypothetical protein